MTYTVLGFCERTGRLGVAAATYSLGVGGLCPFAVGNAGVGASMAFVNPELRFLGAELLAAGHSADAVVAGMKASDGLHEFRQLASLDALGRGAAYTGGRTRLGRSSDRSRLPGPGQRSRRRARPDGDGADL